MGETGQRVSPASDWMFDGEPGHLLLLGLLDQESAGLLGVQEERDEVGQGGHQDPSQSGMVSRDLLD